MSNARTQIRILLRTKKPQSICVIIRRIDKISAINYLKINLGDKLINIQITTYVYNFGCIDKNTVTCLHLLLDFTIVFSNQTWYLKKRCYRWSQSWASVR